MAEGILGAGVPPPGVKPQFDNPDTLLSLILTTVIICASLTSLLTSSRLITKLWVSSWGHEDCETVQSSLELAALQY